MNCPCVMFGEDGTKNHTDIVAQVRDPQYPDYPETIYVCSNHLPLYKLNFIIAMIFERSPQQSTFELGGSDVVQA